jgi:hypothetical protein
MKKMLFMLMALLIASPAFAGVTITCNQPTPGNGRVDINYSVTDANDLARAFALNVQVSAGNISDVTNVNAKYRIYPGTIVIDNGVVTNLGTPVAPNTDLGAKGGIGTSGITLEMGSLYNTSDVNDANKPAMSGLLCSITATAACTVTISGNATRGNVVFESGATTDVSSNCAVTFPPSCACRGDIDRNGYVQSADILALVSLYNTYGTGTRPKQIPSTDSNFDICGDLDNNGFIQSADILALVSMYNTYGVGTRPKQIVCPHAY